jgi:hypothetical protein
MGALLALWPTVVEHVARGSGSLLAVGSMLAISKADLPTYSANYMITPGVSSPGFRHVIDLANRIQNKLEQGLCCVYRCT